MRINGLRAGAVIAAVASAALVLGPGTAAADEASASGSATGGRERIRVDINASGNCDTRADVTIDGQLVFSDTFYQRFGFHKTYPAAVGTPWVTIRAYCLPAPGWKDTLDTVVFDGPVTVAPPNPTLDAIDDALAGAGSSQLRTDQTR